MVADGGEGGDPLPSDHLSKRDRTTLHRLLKRFGEAELHDLIAQERSRLACTPKSDLGALVFDGYTKMDQSVFGGH
jgi:hypothetical protein